MKIYFYIARNGNGELKLFAGKPVLSSNNEFKPEKPSPIIDDGFEFRNDIYLNGIMLPEVTFENSPIYIGSIGEDKRNDKKLS